MEKGVSGKSGIEISALGLGCWAIGGAFFMGTLAEGWIAVDMLTKPQGLNDRKDAF